jgi:hypothetical protein
MALFRNRRRLEDLNERLKDRIVRLESLLLCAGSKEWQNAYGIKINDVIAECKDLENMYNEAVKDMTGWDALKPINSYGNRK